MAWDKPLGPEFSHAGTAPRLAALREVAADTGATVNQVVLAWLIGGELPVIPLVGASSVAQLVSAPASRWRQLLQPVLQKTRLTCYSGAGFDPELASWGGR